MDHMPDLRLLFDDGFATDESMKAVDFEALRGDEREIESDNGEVLD